jgi:3-(methylsulfanyl)propanoyl-CoA dehydrogenase
MSYQAPIAEIRFALESAADLWAAREGGRFHDLDRDLLTAILDGAGALAADTLAPLNRSGDQAGVTLEGDIVRAAPGFREAYKALVDGGWQGLSADPDYGGQGLPRALALAVHEMIHSANMSFGLAPMLTLGAIEALQQHGTDDQKARFLPKLTSGEWSGAMNLTEPQAGSDVGALTTKAVPSGDGRYRLTGQKIFITWGEHDLADNIIHLTLARIEGAPGGSKGVSLFLAPKFLEGGERNSLRCIGVEEKMGIHASPTCTMAYEGALGELIGEENKGLAAMFTMMNSARINVGLQGVAIADAAYQKARAYARERRQGRAENDAEAGASLIHLHPDVRRMLLLMKAKIQAGRALCYATAAAADRGERAREDLLTPLAKAWCTDMGCEAASLGVQVHGGMGYVEEGGAAQFYRDARIAPIYEGTNGIQAADLVLRKLKGDDGAAMRALIEDVRKAAFEFDHPGSKHLAGAADALAKASVHLLAANRGDALSGSAAYLALAAEAAGGAYWALGLAHAKKRADAAPAVLAEQRALFAIFSELVLAAAPGRLPAATLGASALFDPAFDAEF